MIALDQVGYFTMGEKKAVVQEGSRFRLMDEKHHVVLEGIPEKFGFDEASGDNVSLADFSVYKVPGTYCIRTDTGDRSCFFRIGDDVYHELQKDLLKAFYYQRCGCELQAEYAGEYTHACCHTGKAMLWEDHNVLKEVTGGWHDAGDYGRYISPAAVAVGHLLYAFKLFPESFTEEIGIPESGNGIPDILNECRYELEWMLKMQTEDGGAYHKLTSAMHADFIMPEKDDSQFYLFPVSSMATADYAAVMALAAGVYKAYDEAFADRLFTAAERAWDWLETHPEYVGFHNPDNCNTGEYDDECDKDERLWAAAELFVLTGKEKYQRALDMLAKEDLSRTDFGWTDVSGLASMAVLTDKKGQTTGWTQNTFRQSVITEADRLLDVSKASGYMVAMEPEDYVWGSNMVVLNRGMLFILAALISGEKEKQVYEQAALSQLHYLLGTNAAGYSYVTGHGENAYRHPHNRPTECDGIELPMPGWVSGGPFKTPCDETAVQNIEKGTPPMKCYLDDARCYSLNEITIYWNSPAVFLVSYFNKQTLWNADDAERIKDIEDAKSAEGTENTRNMDEENSND
ncbi:MAG: glycoside hydrolase family 9 protein [Roseburia sp.]|nr:glycoside hydrolase family 9 protein [Roseburia sp.]MCM1241392.1 glycoside hydrolase family 9 protein [Roseburia sp.]